MDGIWGWVWAQITGRWAVIRDHWTLCVAIFFIGLACGVAAISKWDDRELRSARADRDLAQDCRKSGAEMPPCPVIKEKTVTRVVTQIVEKRVPAPDPAQDATTDSLRRKRAAVSQQPPPGQQSSLSDQEYWPSLSPKEMDRLRRLLPSAVGKLSPAGKVLSVGCDNPKCRELAKDLVSLFREAGVNAEIDGNGEIGFLREGIAIWPFDEPRMEIKSAIETGTHLRIRPATEMGAGGEGGNTILRIGERPPS